MARYTWDDVFIRTPLLGFEVTGPFPQGIKVAKDEWEVFYPNLDEVVDFLDSLLSAGMKSNG